MLQEYQQLKISEYQNLYDRLIPESHVLRKFNNLMDFSFVRDELEHKYCLNNGRNAISPVMLFKYLILKAYYTMSDADLVERSKYDMSFKYFLGLRPEDDVIHSSTLTKFRKLRLADENILDLLIEKTVAIAIEKGIIKEKCIIVDATHTKARYNQKKRVPSARRPCKNSSGRPSTGTSPPKKERHARETGERHPRGPARLLQRTHRAH